jgi:hypothetical protein
VECLSVIVECLSVILEPWKRGDTSRLDAVTPLQKRVTGCAGIPLRKFVTTKKESPGNRK